jgi:hypothetical protein
MESKRVRIAARVKTYPRQNPARRPPKFAKARHVRKNVDKVGRAIRNIGHNRQRNKTRMESVVKVCFESGYPARKHATTAATRTGPWHIHPPKGFHRRQFTPSDGAITCSSTRIDARCQPPPSSLSSKPTPCAAYCGRCRSVRVCRVR